MTIIDPTTDLGRVRLRVGDYLDITIFSDEVYTAALADCLGNVPRASRLMAQYILGVLSMRVHERLGNVEVFGSDYAKQYIAFLKSTILNPHFMELAPVPYIAGIATQHALTKFRDDYNKNYSSGTQTDLMALTAYGGRGSNYF